MTTQAKRLWAVEAARAWTLDSGIQVRDPKSHVNGAFNAWYDQESKRFQYVYPEITGYGMTTLLYLDTLKADKRLLEKAKAAGDWAIRRAIDPTGGIRPRDHYDRQERSLVFSFERHLVVSFDSGMVLFGLTNVYEATGLKAYLNAAKRVGDFMADKAQKDDGSLYACYNPSKRLWIDKPDKWSTQSGSYHAKLALGLLHLGRLTGVKKYADAAVAICDWSLKQQLPSGRFISWRSDGATHQHPHLYSAEGMIWAGLELKRADYVESAVRAVQWTLSEQDSDGGFPCAVGDRGLRNPHQRSDTLAQCLRLASIFRGRGLAPKTWERKLEKLEKRLLSFQDKKGGFVYGEEMNGERRSHLNFWCTAFALQALHMRADALDGRAPDVRYFV